MGAAKIGGGKLESIGFLLDSARRRWPAGISPDKNKIKCASGRIEVRSLLTQERLPPHFGKPSEISPGASLPP